jgi:hypothetical protein
MAEDRWLELPEHVVAKIQKVLGVSPTSLAEQELVSLIEDLCDTALMFDREECGTEQTEEDKPPREPTAEATAPPSEPPSVAGATEVDSATSDPGSTAAP